MRRFLACVAVFSLLVLAASCGARTGIGAGEAAGGSATGGSGCGQCPAAITCASKGFDCGIVGDGCGCILDCGTCTKPGETCGGSGVPNVCGVPCTASSCSLLALDCGQTGDGCDGTLSCGICAGGTECGTNSANICGQGSCKTCAGQGFSCGLQDDGCGNQIDCGTCPVGTLCGVGSPGQNGVCGAPACAPQTCAEQSYNCGQATDLCGNVIQCGFCSGNQICGAKKPNVCDISGDCTNLCLQQVACPAGVTTTVTGTVFAPNGTDPLYGVLVYVPNAPVTAFAPGVACGDCTSQVSGSPLVSAVTGVDGSFTINNVPVGANIPLVIQNGRWRRQFTIPTVAACVNTALPSAGMPQIRMPQTQLEGDIPLMGFVTGFADVLECVLRKIGIADSEFSDPSGTGRVRFFQGTTMGGALYSVNTPFEQELWSSQAVINAYDMVYFACQGSQGMPPTSAQDILVNYTNAGGRVFATHYSFDWLFQNGPFATAADWDVMQMPNFSADPGVGIIDQTFPEGLALAQWLHNLYPGTTLGQIQLSILRHDFDGVVAPTRLWISDPDPNYPTPVPMHFTFDTPVGAPQSSQCGRVLFDDFHVEDAMVPMGTIFPAECTGGAMTPQEKMLEFMIFDLGACVHFASCASSRTCEQQNVACGPAPDGCGNILQCGTCPANELCVAGTCVGCTPKTCQEQGFTCGQQDDGCGNILQCGSCPSNFVCKDGTCQTGLCTPQTCASLGDTCGPQGDGCGNILQCGTCPVGEFCKAGSCQSMTCTPKTCVEQGFTCGLASDGCDKEIDCGPCTGGTTCGAAKANVCG